MQLVVDRVQITEVVVQGFLAGAFLELVGTVCQKECWRDGSGSRIAHIVCDGFQAAFSAFTVFQVDTLGIEPEFNGKRSFHDVLPPC